MSILNKIQQNAFTNNVVVKKTPVHELPLEELLNAVKVSSVKNKEGNMVLTLKIGIFPVKGVIFGQDKTTVLPEEVDEAAEELLKLVRKPEGVKAVEATREAIKVSAEKRAAKVAENKANPKPKVTKKTREKKLSTSGLEQLLTEE
jgi:hypothetical protein